MALLRSSVGNVLIGTPGRLDDVLTRLAGGLELRTLEVLVRVAAMVAVVVVVVAPDAADGMHGRHKHTQYTHVLSHVHTLIPCLHTPLGA